jgi:CheY-like chemotaxis protein
MSQNAPLSGPILLATDREWHNVVSEFLQQEGFSVLTASSREEALSIIQSQKLGGIVMVSDWAMADYESETAGLMEAVKGKIPTVTLITESSRQQSGYRWFNEVFDPPLHEYCTTPFGLDELLSFMQRAGIVPSAE